MLAMSNAILKTTYVQGVLLGLVGIANFRKMALNPALTSTNVITSAQTSSTHNPPRAGSPPALEAQFRTDLVNARAPRVIMFMACPTRPLSFLKGVGALSRDVSIVLRAPMTPFSFLPVPTPPTESADPAEVAPMANTRSRDVLPEARGPRAPPAARAPPDTRWMSLVPPRGIPNVCSVGNLVRLVQLRSRPVPTAMIESVKLRRFSRALEVAAPELASEQIFAGVPWKKAIGDLTASSTAKTIAPNLEPRAPSWPPRPTGTASVLRTPTLRPTGRGVFP